MFVRMQTLLDGGSVIISAICALHCLALPFLLVLFPLLGATIMTDESFHAVLLWVILPTSLLAAGLSMFRHRDWMVIGLLGVGLITLVAGALWAHDHAVPWVDAAMSVSGGAVLAAGHIRNLLICRQS
jgi:hypothetical protein